MEEEWIDGRSLYKFIKPLCLMSLENLGWVALLSIGPMGSFPEDHDVNQPINSLQHNQKRRQPKKSAKQQPWTHPDASEHGVGSDLVFYTGGSESTSKSGAIKGKTGGQLRTAKQQAILNSPENH